MGLSDLAKTIKKEQKEKNKPLEVKFIEVLDEFLIRNDDYEPSKTFKPSKYYKCQRQTYYLLKGKEARNKKYPRSQRILDVGTALHRWIQDDVIIKLAEKANSPIKLLPPEELPCFKEEGFEIVENKYSSPMEIKFIDHRWTQEFPVSAMVDGWMEFLNLNFLFEFKTIKPEDFGYLIEPTVDHIKQGALYSLCTGVRHILFLYLCKGTQHWKPFLVTYNSEQIDWVRNRIQSTEGYVLRNELPSKEGSRMDCRFCEYEYLCKKDVV